MGVRRTFSVKEAIQSFFIWLMSLYVEIQTAMVAAVGV